MSYIAKKIAATYPFLNEEQAYHRLRYSTFVNFSRRYLYFEVPKAACTTIKSLLHQAEGLPPVVPLLGDYREVSRELFVHDRGQFPLKSIVDFSDEEQREILDSDNFLKFTVVRNPYARLLSAWRDKIVTCQPAARSLYFRLRGALPKPNKPESFISFGEFIDHVASEEPASWDAHWRRQVEHLFFEVLAFTHIGKTENLEATFAALEEKCGLNGVNVVINKSQEMSSYDEALAEKVWTLYGPDFRAFKYGKETWKPYLCNGPILNQAVFDLTERNIVIGTLYEQRHELRNQLADARKELNALEQLRDKLDIACEELAALQLQHAEVKATLDQACAKLADLQKTNSELETQLDVCTHELTQLKSRRLVRISDTLARMRLRAIKLINPKTRG